jgi:hypothetical protein
MPGALASIWNFRFPYDFICMIPNPDFEDFARDYIQLARHEQSPQRRSQLLILAREWMHAAMQDRPEAQRRGRQGKVTER